MREIELEKRGTFSFLDKNGAHKNKACAKVTLFSAITDGIRKNWIASLQKAANVSPTSQQQQQSSSAASPATGGAAATTAPGTSSSVYSTVNEMDVITTTRIVRTSTHSTSQQPNVTKVSSNTGKLELFSLAH